MPTFDTPEPVIATMELVSGRLRIHASDRTDTVVDIVPSDPARDADVQAAEQTQVEYANGRLTVRTPHRQLRSLFGRPPMLDVTIELPAGSRLDVNSFSDIRAEGRLGQSTFQSAVGSIRVDQADGVKLRASAGDVSLGRSTGHTDVSTSTGKIWIGAVEANTVAKTSDGDITVGEANGDVQLKTANGDITIDRALATVVAKTAFGTIRAGEVARGSVTLETNFGEVEIGVPQGTAAWLDVDSKHGMVRSDLRAVEAPGPEDERVEVRARTGYGDIVLHRLGPVSSPTAS